MFRTGPIPNTADREKWKEMMDQEYNDESAKPRQARIFPHSTRLVLPIEGFNEEREITLNMELFFEMDMIRLSNKLAGKLGFNFIFL